MSVENEKSNGVATTDEHSGVGTYAALLEAELRAQDVRKASFEQRGITVVTTSGVLVTLLLGLASLSRSASSRFVLSATASSWLIAGLIAFILAAVLALFTNLPLRYQTVVPDRIKERLDEKPVRSAERAVRDVALTQLKALKDAKTKNGWKGTLLFAAVAVEVIAVALVGVAVCIVISP